MRLENFLPALPPYPPLPRGLFRVTANPGNPVIYDAELEEMTERKREETTVIPGPIVSQPNTEQDDYVVVLRKKNPHPVWLKEYQEKLTQASKIASKKTKHLRGATRVQAMHRIISEILKDGQSGTEGS